MKQELASKRDVASFLNFGVVAFGFRKKDFFIRVFDRSLVETRFFSVRYIALVDVLILFGFLLWIFEYVYGFGIFVFFILTALYVFVLERELEKRLG